MGERGGLTADRQWVEDLTMAILNHYGYTDEQIAETAAIHPGRVCREDECYDEDGESVHPKVYDEAWLTSCLVVDVVEPFVERILAARRESLAERVKALADDLDEAAETWRSLANSQSGIGIDLGKWVAFERSAQLVRALLDPSETP